MFELVSKAMNQISYITLLVRPVKDIVARVVAATAPVDADVIGITPLYGAPATTSAGVGASDP